MQALTRITCVAQALRGAALLRGMGTASAQAAAAASTASASRPVAAKRESILPPRPRRIVRKGPRKLPSMQPVDCPFVATHTVARSTDVAPPGIKLSALRMLGKPVRPDLAEGVGPTPSVAGGGGRGVSFEDTTGSGSSSGGTSSGSSSSSSSSSSGPSSSSSSSESAGSSSEGEGAAAGSATRAGAGSALGAPSPPSSSSSPPPRSFAVIGLGGRQYKVTEGDVINAEHVRNVPLGGSLLVTAVHVVGSPTVTVLGRPTVPGATVALTVEEHAQSAKVVVFKKKRRKRYQKTAGHRRLVTRLRVGAITADVQAWL